MITESTHTISEQAILSLLKVEAPKGYYVTIKSIEPMGKGMKVVVEYKYSPSQYDR